MIYALIIEWRSDEPTRRMKTRFTALALQFCVRSNGRLEALVPAIPVESQWKPFWRIFEQSLLRRLLRC